MNDSTELPDDALLEFLRGITAFKSITSVEQKLLTGDGSGRRFYRLQCTGAKQGSLVLLEAPLNGGPKLAGDKSVSQENAFAELCKYFPTVGIPTPHFFAHDSHRHWILMEDVGDLPLFRFLSSPLNEEEEKIADTLRPDSTTTLFQRAIDLIAKLQAIEVDDKCVAFRRYLSFENYRAEIEEFSTYYAEPRGLKSSAAEALKPIYDGVCETIMSFPRALSLFDYNTHNLFVSPDGNLRVLDFQDACLVNCARDLVSLINDRGLDELLGYDRHSKLFTYFKSAVKIPANFDLIYNLTLLHWDLRVSGRFVKLNTTLNTTKYEQWIPSTLRRLGRTLRRCEKAVHGLSTLLEIGHKFSPEVREGFADPWELPS